MYTCANRTRYVLNIHMKMSVFVSEGAHLLQYKFIKLEIGRKNSGRCCKNVAVVQARDSIKMIKRQYDVTL